MSSAIYQQTETHMVPLSGQFFFSIFTWHLSDANQRERDERPGGIKPANLCKAAKVSHKSSFAKTTIVRGQHRCQWPHQEWREIMWVPRDRLPSRTQRHTVQGCRVKLLGPDTQTHCSQRPGRECTSCTGEGGTTAWGASGQLLQCNNSVCSLPPPITGSGTNRTGTDCSWHSGLQRKPRLWTCPTFVTLNISRVTKRSKKHCCSPSSPSTQAVPKCTP